MAHVASVGRRAPSGALVRSSVRALVQDTQAAVVSGPHSRLRERRCDILWRRPRPMPQQWSAHHVCHHRAHPRFARDRWSRYEKLPASRPLLVWGWALDHSCSARSLGSGGAQKSWLCIPMSRCTAALMHEWLPGGKLLERVRACFHSSPFTPLPPHPHRSASPSGAGAVGGASFLAWCIVISPVSVVRDSLPEPAPLGPGDIAVEPPPARVEPCIGGIADRERL